ncbi:hypothetical protein D3C78_1450270 [compost metagenome]
MLQIVGLGDVGHGTGTHATILEKCRFLRRKHHHAAMHLLHLDPCQDIQAIERRQVEVQHHQFRLMLADHRQHFVTAGRLVDALVSFQLEYDFDCTANHRMIVHNQRCLHGNSLCINTTFGH